MNCLDWQTRIAAGESNDPATAEHLRGCMVCSDFARDLAENTAALRSLEPDAAAYTALRARVMAAVRPRRGRGWLWAGAGVALATAIAMLWITAPLRAPEPPRPSAVVFPIDAPELAPRMVARERVHTSVNPGRRSARATSLTAIKLLTDDPNVVIIWLMDEKGDVL